MEEMKFQRNVWGAVMYALSPSPLSLRLLFAVLYALCAGTYGSFCSRDGNVEKLKKALVSHVRAFLVTYSTPFKDGV